MNCCSLKFSHSFSRVDWHPVHSWINILLEWMAKERQGFVPCCQPGPNFSIFSSHNLSSLKSFLNSIGSFQARNTGTWVQDKSLSISIVHFYQLMFSENNKYKPLCLGSSQNNVTSMTFYCTHLYFTYWKPGPILSSFSKYLKYMYIMAFQVQWIDCIIWVLAVILGFLILLDINKSQCYVVWFLVALNQHSVNSYFNTMIQWSLVQSNTVT